MRISRLVAPVLAIVGAAAVAGLGLAALGADPLRAGEALWRGAFGDAIALENTLVRMGPLVLIGLAVALSFRAGIWNIGGEGQLYVGALVATAVATRLLGAVPPLVALPATLGAGVLAGALWAGIAGVLKVHRGVSEVLSTILLNFVATLGVAWAVRGPLQEMAGAFPQSDLLPDAARLGVIPGTLRIHAGLGIALALPPLAWLFLFRSAAGLRLRSIGLSLDAARFAGMSPERETVRVLLISGALAGLAGSLEVSGVTGRLFENLSPGYGFTAIAVALLARLNPLAVLPSAAFFAALASGSGAMQRQAGVPSVTVQIIEALTILFSVGFALPERKS
ncbi:MAG: ABC transporter permease [Myxococcota bacterium]